MNPSRSFQCTLIQRMVFIRLKEILVEASLDLFVQDRDAELIQRLEMLLNEFPKRQRWIFLFFLQIFNLLPFFFGYGFKKFIQLSPENAQRYGNRWLGSRRSLFRENFKRMRHLVIMVYFSHPEVWQAIGYDPARHVAERQALREKILREERSGGEGS